MARDAELTRCGHLELPTAAGCQRCFFANALPECDFKYFSNSSALYLLGKAEYQANFHGANFAVCVDLPAL
jgi:hypothetical protein